MEILIFALFPILFLLSTAGLLAAGQLFGFLQSARSSDKERRTGRLLARFAAQIVQAESRLGKRSRELEELSSRLRFNNDELARLNTLKTKFLAMAVHDIRTPLASVRGFNELLNRSPRLGPGEKKMVGHIDQATEQIGSLISDLTDLALIESGKYKLQMSSFFLHELISEVLPPVGFSARSKSIQLKTGAVPAGVRLTGDRLRLGRVLSNLLGNAIKFTPAGGRVELGVSAAGGWITFAVKDTGPGIHPSERRRVFEKFYQSAHMKDAKAKAAGWGLGLAISEEIVRGHGGRIGVDSPGLGRGATFWVRVPEVPPRRSAPGGARALAAGVLFLMAGGPDARAQGMPLDEKARYEAHLGERADGVLKRMLGPNRGKVVVDATLDLTRIEKYENREATGAARAANSAYLWADAQAAAGGPPELLPSVPMPGGALPQGAPFPRSYERRNSYAGDFLKKLAVTVVLDASVDAKSGEEARSVVAQVLGVTAARGDTLTVVRAPFIPIWKTVWNEPELAGLVVKYLMISVLSFVTLGVVAVSLLKLSGAMREVALAQKYSLSMDVGGGGAGGPSDLAGPEAPPPARLEHESGSAAEPPEFVRFAVRPDQVDALADLLSAEEPGNVALVMEHLEEEIKTGLLRALPVDLSHRVLASLGSVRYVDPDTILNLKEELERRLSGAVGGLARLVEILEAEDLPQRQRLVEALGTGSPELGVRLRRRVFLLGNLASLNGGEWAVLATRLTHEDWALALADGPAPVVEALLSSLPEGERKVLREMIQARPGDEASRRAARDKVAKASASLVAEGRLGTTR